VVLELPGLVVLLAVGEAALVSFVEATARAKLRRERLSTISSVASTSSSSPYIFSSCSSSSRWSSSRYCRDFFASRSDSCLIGSACFL